MLVVKEFERWDWHMPEGVVPGGAYLAVVMGMRWWWDIEEGTK